MEAKDRRRCKATRVICRSPFPPQKILVSFLSITRRARIALFIRQTTPRLASRGGFAPKGARNRIGKMRSHLWSTVAKRSTTPFQHRHLATAVHGQPRAPQTVIEKVVQKYAVGLAPQRTVRAVDYVMIRPQHVMTHDNTGPVISKCVQNPLSPIQ